MRTQHPVLRAADAADFDTIATIWHGGWLDGHVGHVPCYERDGWTDRGPIDYAAHIDGGTALIPSRRYEKPMSRPAADPSTN